MEIVATMGNYNHACKVLLHCQTLCFHVKCFHNAKLLSFMKILLRWENLILQVQCYTGRNESIPDINPH